MRAEFLGRQLLRRPRRRCEYNIEIGVQQVIVMWTPLNWLKIRTTASPSRPSVHPFGLWNKNQWSVLLGSIFKYMFLMFGSVLLNVFCGVAYAELMTSYSQSGNSSLPFGRYMGRLPIEDLLSYRLFYSVLQENIDIGLLVPQKPTIASFGVQNHLTASQSKQPQPWRVYD